MYVGIDWCAESHNVCVVTPSGKFRGRVTVPHSQEGFAELASDRAVERCDAAPLLLDVGGCGTRSALSDTGTPPDQRPWRPDPIAPTAHACFLHDLFGFVAVANDEHRAASSGRCVWAKNISNTSTLDDSASNSAGLVACSIRAMNAEVT